MANHEQNNQKDNQNDQRLEAKRSAVRRKITYWVILAYLLLAAIVVIWLMWAGRYEVAIGVLGGVAGLAGSISGFWFGSRQSEKKSGNFEGNNEVPLTPESRSD